MCKDLYEKIKAEDLARHLGKMVNEQTGVFCNPTPEALYQLRIDMIEVVQQLRGAIDLIDYMRENDPHK